mgnify:CR=1 FL=1
MLQLVGAAPRDTGSSHLRLRWNIDLSRKILKLQRHNTHKNTNAFSKKLLLQVHNNNNNNNNTEIAFHTLPHVDDRCIIVGMMLHGIDSCPHNTNLCMPTNHRAVQRSTTYHSSTTKTRILMYNIRYQVHFKTDLLMDVGHRSFVRSFRSSFVRSFIRQPTTTHSRTQPHTAAPLAHCVGWGSFGVLSTVCRSSKFEAGAARHNIRATRWPRQHDARLHNAYRISRTTDVVVVQQHGASLNYHRGMDTHESASVFSTS